MLVEKTGSSSRTWSMRVSAFVLFNCLLASSSAQSCVQPIQRISLQQLDDSNIARMHSLLDHGEPFVLGDVQVDESVVRALHSKPKSRDSDISILSVQTQTLPPLPNISYASGRVFVGREGEVAHSDEGCFPIYSLQLTGSKFWQLGHWHAQRVMDQECLYQGMVEVGDLLVFYPFASHRATIHHLDDPGNLKSRSLNGELVHKPVLQHYDHLPWLPLYCNSWQEQRTSTLADHALALGRPPACVGDITAGQH